MSFDQLQRRVQRAEQLLEGREQQVLDRSRELMSAWRAGWTPLRIVSAGLVTGFLAGRTDPLASSLRAVGAARWLQMVGALSGMFTSLSAALAAHQAGKAADSADDAAGNAQAAAAAPAPPAPAGRAPATAAKPAADGESWASTPPRPAEAATEVSERPL